MEMVSLVEARPGRVLARPVTNASGAVLCPAGSLLTESLMQRLENAGVETVCLEGGGRLAPSAAERIAMLDARFAGITDPALLELKAAVTARLEAMRSAEEAAGEQP